MNKITIEEIKDFKEFINSLRYKLKNADMKEKEGNCYYADEFFNNIHSIFFVFNINLTKDKNFIWGLICTINHKNKDLNFTNRNNFRTKDNLKNYQVFGGIENAINLMENYMISLFEIEDFMEVYEPHFAGRLQLLKNYIETNNMYNLDTLIRISKKICDDLHKIDFNAIELMIHSYNHILIILLNDSEKYEELFELLGDYHGFSFEKIANLSEDEIALLEMNKILSD